MAKSYRPISLLCHLYNLFEHLILNRLDPITEQHVIPEQAGFRPGRSCTSQVLNLTKYIENGFVKNQPTGLVFVDFTAAYDTVNHHLLLNKLYKMTSDILLTKLVQLLLGNRRFFVELNGSAAGGGYREMVSLRAVFSLRSSSTYTRTTSLSHRVQGASSMPMTWASLLRTGTLMQWRPP